MPRERLATRERLLAGIALPLLTLVPIWLTTSTPALETGPSSDQRYYAAMALRELAPPQLTRTAPWCWRILTPFQASLLPVGAERPFIDAVANFKWLAFASNWISLALLYALLHRLGAGRTARIFGVLAYAGVHWTIKFSFRVPAYVDFQMQTLIIAILALAAAGRTWWTLPLFGLCALQKETALFLIPVVALQRWSDERRFGRSDWLWLASALALPALAVALVRASITPVNPYDPTRVVRWVVSHQLADPQFWPRLLVAVFSGLGLLPLLLAWRARALGHLLRERPAFGLYLVCGVLLLFGGVDKARLLLPLTPAVAALATLVWQPVLSERGWPVLGWVTLTLVLHAYLGHLFEPMGPPGGALARLAPVHAADPIAPSLARIGVVAAGWGAATLALTRRRTTPTPASGS